MKIAFHRKPHFFLDLESARLKERLAAHDFYDWFAGDEAPANDLDVVLVVGSFDKRAIAHGVWVSFAPAAETGNAISVAELAVMLMIGAIRRLNRALASVHDHELRTNHLATALRG